MFLQTPTAETPWQLTRVSRQRYYEPIASERPSWENRVCSGTVKPASWIPNRRIQMCMR